MTTTVDTNILVYASDTGATEHGQAQALLEHLADGPDLVVLLWPALLGYLRITSAKRHAGERLRRLSIDPGCASRSTLTPRSHRPAMSRRTRPEHHRTATEVHGTRDNLRFTGLPPSRFRGV